MALKAFPDAAEALARHTASPWLGTDYTMKGSDATFLGALKEGLYGIFKKTGSQYNNVLWTMRIELFGSFGVYLFFQYVRRHQMLLGLLITSGMLALHANRGYVAFALGALLFMAWRSGKVLPPRAAMALFLVGLVLGSHAEGFAGRHGLDVLPLYWAPGSPRSYWHPIGALLVVAGILFSPWLQRLLERPTCQFLGHISFPIYLLHVPLICTVVAWTAVRFDLLQGGGLLALFAGFLLVSIAMAWLFERWVDQPAVRLKARLPG